MSNFPEVKVGVVAVSRDCFPESLSVNRRKALMEAYTAKFGTGNVYECPVCIVESEIHMVQALEDIKKQAAMLCAYISETLVPKSARPYWQSILTDRLCSSRQQKKARIT